MTTSSLHLFALPQISLVLRPNFNFSKSLEFFSSKRSNVCVFPPLTAMAKPPLPDCGRLLLDSPLLVSILCNNSVFNFFVFFVTFRIGCNCLRNNDFPEGVRALLVDKDKNPRWKPDSLEGVTDEMVENYFKLPAGVQDLKL